MKYYSPEQKATIFVVIITSFIATFTGSALNLSIPAMSKAFNVSAATIGWIVTSAMLTPAALAVPFGRLADITEKRRIFILGLLIFSVSSLFAAFAFNFTVMIVLRVAQGVGSAMVFSTATAILISAFPGSDRGKVLGYSVAATYIGLSSGPVAGGILNHYLGWPSIFIMTFLFTAAAFFISVAKLPKSETRRSGMSFDIPGNVIYIIMIVTIMYGFSEIAVFRFSAALIGLGVVLAVYFVIHELRIESPIIQVRLFTGNIAYSFSNLATLMNYAATFAIGYLLSIYFQVVMRYSSQTAGLMLISQPIVMALISPYAGRLSDRVSPYKLASLGMGFCAAGLLFFVFITENYPLWLITLALIVTGIGFGLFSSPNTNAVMACVEAKDYGVASSILATMRSLGHTASMAIVTLVVRTHMGSTALVEARPGVLIETMHTAFIIFTCICAVGIFFSAIRKKDGV